MKDIPIVCNASVFSKEQKAKHIDLVLDVLFRLPKNVKDLQDGYQFEYEGNEELFLKIANYAGNEHRCCSWASFSIKIEPFPSGEQGRITLNYISGAEAKAALTEAIEHARKAATDPAEYKRLVAAFVGVDKIDFKNEEAFYNSIHQAKKATFFEKLKSKCGC